MFTYQTYIDGKWVDAASGKTFQTFDPYTGEPWALIPECDKVDVDRAVEAASRAFETGPWPKMTPTARGKIMRRIAQLIEKHSEHLGQIEVRDNGKLISEMAAQTKYMPEWFYYYGGLADKVQGAVVPVDRPEHFTYILREPVGVCAFITPWNSPLMLVGWKLAPALAAGCTVIVKPASETPLTMLALAPLLEEAGVPDGVVNMVTSRRSSAVVNAMLQDPRVRVVSFTGSTETGRRILRSAADAVVNPRMELGGNAPFIVLKDADLEAAVAGDMVAKMRNMGEACTAANRFYVHEDVHDEFVARLARAMAALKVGNGLEAGVSVGPLVNAATRDKVEALVEDARARGAQVVTGGHRLPPPGYFYAPTVLAQVPDEALCLREEIFGPVAPVQSFRDEEQLVARANASEYGLVAYLYTRDLARGLALSERLEAGMVALNRGIVSDPAAPFGGVKQSGLGREGAHEGMMEFLETQYVSVSW
jgi:succinate-semialdehyde dehydrogenase/glutarate-semialdehyde dehydrogenase